MVLKRREQRYGWRTLFENDVKTYGTETQQALNDRMAQFENDVKTYGTETAVNALELLKRV